MRAGSLQRCPCPQDKLAYHQRSSHALSPGLYLGYLKLCSAVDQIRVLVPEQLPNILCHVKIRSNPNISRWGSGGHLVFFSALSSTRALVATASCAWTRGSSAAPPPSPVPAKPCLGLEKAEVPLLPPQLPRPLGGRAKQTLLSLGQRVYVSPELLPPAHFLSAVLQGGVGMAAEDGQHGGARSCGARG